MPAKAVSVKWAVVIAALLAFACKIALALNTYGSNDVITWERHLAAIKEKGAMGWYRDGAEIADTSGHLIGYQAANHPPLVIRTLSAWDFAARLSGLPLRFWMRFTSALADIGSLLLVWGIAKASGLRVRPLALLLVALSPVSVMISGFHGNTDPLMVFFLLCSLYLLEKGRYIWLAAAAFGLAMSIKIVAIIFLPVFLLQLLILRRRLEFTMVAAAVAIVGALPFLAEDPALIFQRVLLYSPQSGGWGLSQMASIFLPTGANAFYLEIGKAVVLCAVLWVSFWMNRGSQRPALYLQCGCIAFLFLFLTPGFGVQFLAWLVPWGAALSERKIMPYYAASTAFLFAFYTIYSGGFPWFLANSFTGSLQFWPGFVLFTLDVACWISVGAVVYAYVEGFLDRGIVEETIGLSPS